MAERDGWQRWLAAVVVLVSAAALLGWTSSRQPAPPSAVAGARQVPVDATSLVCRGIGGSGDPSAGVTSTLLTPDQGADLDLTAELLDSDRQRLDLLPSGPGELASAELGRPGSGVLLAAQGPAAGSLQAWSASVAGRDQGAGLAVAACPRPGADEWFVGAGSTVDQDSTILLRNPGGSSAVTDVSFLTPDGALRPTRTQGLVLEPGRGVELELAELIAGTGDVAVHVETREGQVTAQVLDRWSGDRRPAGTEWIPGSTGPATRTLLAGLPTRVEGSQLVMANPGDLGAVVSVQVVGPDATYVPEGLRGVSVPAGSTASVPLPGGLDGRVVGLLVESDQPVLTTIRGTTRGGRPDIAYVVGTTGLTGPAAAPVALPVDVGDRAPGPLLALVATGAEDGVVQVQTLDGAGGEVATLDVDVPVGATTVLDLSRRADLGIPPREATQVAQVVLLPTGDVSAALVHAPRTGALSILPVQTPPSTVVAPAVLPRGLSPRR